MAIILQIPINAKSSTYIIISTDCDFSPTTIQFKVIALVRRRTDFNFKSVGKTFLETFQHLLYRISLNNCGQKQKEYK